MNARELIRNPVLSYGQTAFFLGVSKQTLHRWESQNSVPRAPSLVLQSIWSGLPVLARAMWSGWRFAPDGSLRTPGDYPLWPSDLWCLEFLYRNGLFSSAARGEWLTVERIGLTLDPDAAAPNWHPLSLETRPASAKGSR